MTGRESETKGGDRSDAGVAGAARRVLVGSLVGALGGVATTLAVVVARAWVAEVYVESMADLVGWIGLPLVILPLVGLVLGVRGGPIYRRAVGVGLAGLALGLVVGVLAGALTGDATARWAGGIVGAAAGLLLGAVGGGLLGARAGTATALVAAVLLTGCGGEARAPLPEPGAFEEPGPAEVETVLFFVGDPGEARIETHPVLTRVRREVEAWSAALERQGGVGVVVLGDVVYPDGMHEPGHPEYPGDSAVVASQIAMVSGPEARRWRTQGIFLAGNHDWGQQENAASVERLANLERFLDGWREARGTDVQLHPRAGTGGPASFDVGQHLRLLLLDTAWWLMEGDTQRRQMVAVWIARGLQGAGDREVVVAAHHPYRSGGPHGDLATLGGTLGLRTVLARSGALLQDLRSRPYRELRRDLRDVFAWRGAPALFVGGHEHSLQVIRGEGEAEPRVSLVSGAASRLTDVGPTPGQVFARSVPGYARLFVRTDGSLHLTVEGAPAEYLACPGEDDVEGASVGGDTAACLREGVEAFRTIWSGPV